MERDTEEPRLRACADTAISVEFGDRLDPAVNDRVIALDAAIRAADLAGVVETVPTYRALLVHVDPLAADLDALRRRLRELARSAAVPERARRHWRVPVVYGGDFGEDLEEIAGHAGLSPAAFVEAHVAGRYTVGMIGFLPGFSYLMGLDPRLAMPRRPEPRLKVPASSVAIGGAQTAIGSVEGPSGWRLIGRTPVRPFLPSREPMFLFQPGDRICFEPVAAEAWPELDARAAAGEPVAAREDPA